MTVAPAEATETRTFFGQVVARETVDLAFQVGGQVAELPVVEGAPVAEGALVAELDLTGFELSLEEARLRKEQADSEIARLERLSAGAVSQANLDAARTQAALADVAVRSAEDALGDATLRAPFDGIVAARNVARFATISAGTPIVRLHDMSEVRVEIDVPEVLFQQAGENPDVDVVAQFPASDRTFPLEVREFNAEASPIGQTFRLTFGMAPPEGLRVLPGASVVVIVNLKGQDAYPVVPAAAIAIAPDDTTSVLVFTPGEGETGTLSRAEVRVEPAEAGGFSVVEGLAAGAEIVAAGVDALSEGQTVRRFSGFGE